MKVLQYFSILLISFIMIEGICLIAGIRVNTSESIPLGIYRTTGGSIEKGDFVFFCPPPSPVFTMAKDRGYLTGGFCPGGYGYMMKNVAGTEGDIITVDDDGVLVNGILLPWSKPLQDDQAGQPLPRFRTDSQKLGKAEVLLMSGFCHLSFDGRYFGPINRIQIRAVIRPVYTW